MTESRGLPRSRALLERAAALQGLALSEIGARLGLTRSSVAGMCESSARRGPYLRPLSILQLERMTPAQLQRREFEEVQERQAWLDQQRRAAPARRP